MKVLTTSLIGMTLAAFSAAPSFAKAYDPVSKRQAIEKIEKNIAADKEKIAGKKAEIVTAHTKLNTDITQYGTDSPEARKGRERLTDLREDLVDLKTALYKDNNKKKVFEDYAIEKDAVS